MNRRTKSTRTALERAHIEGVTVERTERRGYWRVTVEAAPDLAMEKPTNNALAWLADLAFATGQGEELSAEVRYDPGTRLVKIGGKLKAMPDIPTKGLAAHEEYALQRLALAPED